MSGSEPSFVDKGYKNIVLGRTVYFDSPRIVALRSMKIFFPMVTYSLVLDPYKQFMIFSTRDNRVSPAIDVDNASVVFTQ